MQTGADNAAPSLTLWDVDVNPKETNLAALAIRAPKKKITLALGDPDKDAALILTGAAGAQVPLASLGMKDQGELLIDATCATLKFQDAVHITLNPDSITLVAPGHSIKLDSSGITIAGTNIKIDGLTTDISSLQTKVEGVSKKLDATSRTAAMALQKVLKAERAAAAKP